MDYRPLTVDDSEAYRAHRLRGLREHPDAFTSSAEEEAARPLSDTQKRLTDPATWLWGAFDGQRLVGVVGLQRELRPKNAHKGAVLGMYVQPDYERQGVGAALMERAVAHARLLGLRLLVLTVTRGNEAAERLYTRVGFRRFGVEPQAIRVDGRSLDKVHMAMELIPAED